MDIDLNESNARRSELPFPVRLLPWLFKWELMYHNYKGTGMVVFRPMLALLKMTFRVVG